MTRSLHVRIISPKQTLFEDNVYAISSINSSGKFDIIPEHANFITLVENKPIQIRKLDGKVITFNFALAIIYAQSNNVNVYTEIQQVASSSS